MADNLGPTRPRRPDELVTALAQSAEQLSDRCLTFKTSSGSWAAVHGNDAEVRPPRDPSMGAISEAAGIIRRLVNPRRGDRLIVRVAEAYGVEAPTVHRSAVAELDPDVGPKLLRELVSVGALPGERSLGSAVVSLDELMQDLCVCVVEPALGTIELRWGELVRGVANKEGVHVDADRPMLWDYLDQHTIGFTHLLLFLIYRLGVELIDLSSELLKDVGYAGEVASGLPRAIAGLEVGAVQVSEALPIRGTGRNEGCPCGSGRKYKHCHLRRKGPAIAEAG